MSTYILMKILESAPERYDRGISILTLGRLDTVYENLASHIKKGQRVLDIGCGTGAMSLRAAQKGAVVKGIDINAQMLEIAQRRAQEKNVCQGIEFCEIGVAELCDEQPESYDVVMSTLCFSELSEDELVYTLKEVKRILKRGGRLLVADEIKSNRISKR
ncbi:MAG: corrinoid protein-associated methyltransferase CpaM, partial [bacterium]